MRYRWAVVMFVLAVMCGALTGYFINQDDRIAANIGVVITVIALIASINYAVDARRDSRR